jgi:membrane-associated protein
MEILDWIKEIASKDTLQHIGHIGIWAIIFAEPGILAGFFLPGDSLLFTAGLLASTGTLNLYYLLIGGSIAAITGDSFGYYLGRKFGPRVFTREDSRFFHKDHVERARQYFTKYGPITIFLARFMPFIRTFAPVLAGVGKMEYGTFIFYNVFGGIFWVISMTLLGYFLGRSIPDIDRYVLPIVGTIILVSVIPALIGVIRSRLKNR